MITKLIIDFWAALLGAPVSWMPTDGPPSWIYDGNQYIQTALGYGNGLGAWIPWSTIAVVLPAVFAAFLVGLTIRIARMILSLFTGGGGSAA